LAEMWHLQVHSPDRVLLDLREVSHVKAQLIDGPITILRGHHPLVGEMAAGALRYYTTDGAGELYLEPGILVVERGRITVLTSGLAGRQPASGHP